MWCPITHWFCWFYPIYTSAAICCSSQSSNQHMFSGLYSLTSLSMCWYFRSYPDGAGISSKCHVSVILLLSCSKFDWFTPKVRYFYPDSWFVAEKVSSTLSGVVIMITSGLYTPCDVFIGIAPTGSYPVRASSMLNDMSCGLNSSNHTWVWSSHPSKKLSGPLCTHTLFGTMYSP